MLLATQLKEAQVTQLKIRRGDQERVLVMVPEPICSFEVRYSPSSRMGAASNGSVIVVSHGLMTVAATDEALALVIAREVGHNILDHAGARKAYLFLGGLADMLAATQGIVTQGAFQTLAAGVKAAEFEGEADYVGLYLMARAGIAVRDAPEQWQQLVTRLPSRSHYVDKDPAAVAVRTIAMRQTVREIREKRDTGAPLLPELKTSDDYPVRDESLANR
jgi:Zn-dependent protease with chaperone function